MTYVSHMVGELCEIILTENLLRRGWYVYKPLLVWGPIDVIAVTPRGKIFLFDAKADRFRRNPGRKKGTHQRIYRPRSALQKLLGVRIAYVDEEKRSVWFVPALPDSSSMPDSST